MPRHIAKWGRPLPHFMKYRNPYYARQKLSRSLSNMNKLCWELERWDKGIRWKRIFPEFDYSIMIDQDVQYSEETALAVEQVFLEFGRETRKLHLEQSRIREYRDSDIKEKYNKADAKFYKANWKVHYDLFRQKFRQACSDERALANILVRLGYEKYPKRDKRFMWNMNPEGILLNIRQTSQISLPKRNSVGEFEYLGRKYSMVNVSKEEIESGGLQEID